jgi:hypothetical protein
MLACRVVLRTIFACILPCRMKLIHCSRIKCKEVFTSKICWIFTCSDKNGHISASPNVGQTPSGTLSRPLHFSWTSFSSNTNVLAATTVWSVKLDGGTRGKKKKYRGSFVTSVRWNEVTKLDKSVGKTAKYGHAKSKVFLDHWPCFKSSNLRIFPRCLVLLSKYSGTCLGDFANFFRHTYLFYNIPQQFVFSN